MEETGLVSLDGKWRGIANVLLSQFIVEYPPPPIHLKHNRHGHGQDSGLASMWSFNWKRGLTRECLLNNKNPELIPRKILCRDTPTDGSHLTTPALWCRVIAVSDEITSSVRQGQTATVLGEEVIEGTYLYFAAHTTNENNEKHVLRKEAPIEKRVFN